ncbi:lymphocyte cytosolic protein 2 isoform X1 [Parasteatoda tepidariorum]|uniref:lymphocyte cytosolic protein 2 isoform X1 n=1 Tax=Parasteatoda tepidariorum TaxID=114398 RepID=UPI001C71DD05|nr:lymphocyte cytosolic protein 2 isoform X1 [Parasteatoda tepidariorum]
MSSKISLPHHSFVASWKEEKVIKWLKKVNLDECIPSFEIRHIDGAKLLELTEQKLFTYQDMKIKHRKQIAKCVQECKSQASNAKRIAKNLKHGQGSSHSHSSETNGNYDSEDDFDDWGSDFEDSDDEVVSEESLEVNNNSIIPPSPECESKSSGSSPIHEIPREKTIPKPPDISIVPKSVAESIITRNSNQTTCVSRPPLKRPPSQPPPPPVSQVLSQEEPQEDYEIPIVSSSASVNVSSLSLQQNTVNQTTVIETYEIVEAPEENYEIVDPPMNSSIMSEKPLLPPRHIKCPGSVSPPPLPQKPLKLKENLLGNERIDGVKTFCRPKLPIKPNNDYPAESSPPTTSPNIGFISSLMGRRSSTPTSSPKTQHKGNVDNFSTSPSNMKFLSGSHSSLSSSSDKDGDVKKTMPLPPLPPRSVLNALEETAQNMATRPLPPVPTSKSDDKLNEILEQDIQSYPWFHEIEREYAETAVKKLNEPGSFVVRPSKRAGKENPYSLTVLHESKLFHLNVRQRSDNTYALGKEKEKEKTFSTVAELIVYHQNEPILLKNRGEPAGKTKLCKYPEKT